MAGVRGRSGRKRLPAHVHLDRGTFRPDRHGSREAALAAREQVRRFGSTVGATALAPAVEELPVSLTAGLDVRGSAFVVSLWREYEDWAPSKLLLLHELGGVVDTLTRYESMVAAAAPGVLTETDATIARLRAQAQRTYVLLLAKLDLKG